MIVTNTHIFFLKEWLSNFKMCSIIFEDRIFNNTEQLFMYRKAIFFKDNEIAIQILNTPQPFEAKALGRRVSGYDDESWSKVRYQVMYESNLLKYKQNEVLKTKLLATCDKILVEVNPRDNIWGIGLSEDNPDIYNEHKWKGKNLLGLALMEVRDTLRK